VINNWQTLTLFSCKTGKFSTFFSTLGHITSIQALQNWRKKRPEFFDKPVYNQVELGFFLNSKLCEKYVGATAR
jgi:hypothetical protein